MRIVLTIILSIGGVIVFGAFHKIFIHYHAFMGMSKTRKKKILKEQDVFSRLLALYATTRQNKTKEYSITGTWCCLIGYYLFLLSVVIVILLIFFEIVIGNIYDLGDIPSSRPMQALADFSLTCIIRSPVLSFVSLIFNRKRK